MELISGQIMKDFFTALLFVSTYRTAENKFCT